MATTQNSGTELPRPPSLAETYTAVKSGGLTAVFSRWDENLRQFFDRYAQASALNKDVPVMTGGKLLRPGLRTAAAADAVQFSQPHDVLGWSRFWWDPSETYIDHHSTSGGWPIEILYSKADRQSPNATVCVQYRLSLRYKTEWKHIPESRKRAIAQTPTSNVYIPTANLIEPHLRVSMQPTYGFSEDCEVVNRGSYKSTWRGPGDDYGVAWQHFYWLRASVGSRNIPARSIYAELL